MGDWEINQVCFCHCKNFCKGVFVFVQFSERKDAVESFMVAGKKGSKTRSNLFLIYFLLFVTAIHLIYYKLDINSILNTHVRIFVYFIKKVTVQEHVHMKFKGWFVCLFVLYFWYHSRISPSNGDVTITQRRYANFYLHLVLMVIEKWRFYFLLHFHSKCLRNFRRVKVFALVCNQCSNTNI